MKAASVNTETSMPERARPHRRIPAAHILFGMVLGLAISGCTSKSPSSGTTPTPPTVPQGSSKLYFSPTMGDTYAATYAIDHTANTFTRKVYGFNQSPADGPTVTDSGKVSSLSNGILSLGTTYNESSSGVSTTYDPSLSGSWAVEIPGEAALIGMQDYPTFTPVVQTNVCPAFSTAQTIQFVTIPNRLSSNATMVVQGNWNPQLETAFGSAQITVSGAQVQFTSVKQSTFPSGGKAGTPVSPGPGSATATCDQTFYGSTIGVPNTVDVINPGTQESVPPSATIGVGPSGFLVEDAGSSQVTGEPYENILGAGYGAIGLPQPSSALSASTLATAQYQGFLYGSGGPVTAGGSGAGFSLVGSFGYSDLQASCPTLPAPKTGGTLFGGEFQKNDPSSHAFGNCDLAIDLGAADSGSNGLFPAATVYVAAAFPQNVAAKSYSFPAVAIAGQISGKYAIFLIGTDTTGSPQQAWGIYLIQSH
jgi:hypothetical protein